MKERPILFSAPMVRAILDGRKTQTRRIVKPQPFFGRTNWHDYECWNYDKGKVRLGFGTSNKGEQCLTGQNPYGKPGDYLWVRETWAAHVGWDKLKPSDLAHDAKANFWFAADPDGTDGTADIPSFRRGKWRPSIFMPRWASRILLEITDVRVQRLQEISAQDCLSEGVSDTDLWTPKEVEGRPFEEKWWDDCHFWENYPQIVMRRLWESINGEGAWDANPWVWAITFKRIKTAERAA